MALFSVTQQNTGMPCKESRIIASHLPVGVSFALMRAMFRDSANIRNPLALRPHVWRVPNSNALSCKHEQLSNFEPWNIRSSRDS